MKGVQQTINAAGFCGRANYEACDLSIIKELGAFSAVDVVPDATPHITGQVKAFHESLQPSTCVGKSYQPYFLIGKILEGISVLVTCIIKIFWIFYLS